jgi:hypothetical protein
MMPDRSQLMRGGNDCGRWGVWRYVTRWRVGCVVVGVVTLTTLTGMSRVRSTAAPAGLDVFTVGCNLDDFFRGMLRPPKRLPPTRSALIDFGATTWSAYTNAKQSDEMTVLAPQGWHCTGRSSPSAQEVLVVAPGRPTFLGDNAAVSVSWDHLNHGPGIASACEFFAEPSLEDDIPYYGGKEVCGVDTAQIRLRRIRNDVVRYERPQQPYRGGAILRLHTRYWKGEVNIVTCRPSGTFDASMCATIIDEYLVRNAPHGAEIRRPPRLPTPPRSLPPTL